MIVPHAPATLAIAAHVLLAAGAFAPMSFIYTSEWVAADHCLDSGKPIDYDAMRCDYRTIIRTCLSISDMSVSYA